ncbi:hypothetical protein K9L97_03110 [Candidatus Woesearchaeota archaeon]|nr:hypothetical protein [Candidatus Woesearchaeota archaeon]
MAIKTFNVDEETYRKFSEYCKSSGISMSKQINNFMKTMTEDEREVREEYLERLERIRKGKYIKVKDLEKHFNV